MSEAIFKFRDAICASGLEPPHIIKPGKVHRFPGIGKRPNNLAGWCLLFDDGMGGCFGDWSSDFSELWQASRNKELTTAELDFFRNQVSDARKHAQEDGQKQQEDSQQKADNIWIQAEPLNEEHNYLITKNIMPFGARLYKGSIVIPIYCNGELSSLQFINTDGKKLFLKGGRVSGGYYTIGKTLGTKALCIAEGFATGATIHQATSYPVVIAFNAGNLEPVATYMRPKFPDIPIIICADDDIDTDGNPGVAKATIAAQIIGASVALPVFGDQRPNGVTDFNDMAASVGFDEVAAAINSARNANDSWPTPESLLSKIEPEDYPLSALPEIVGRAVAEVLDFTKAPVPLVASSALAALSLAIQAHTDVKRAEKLSGPTGLFLLTIADSGERKSTCDGFFMQAIRAYEVEQEKEAQPEIKNHEAAMQSWNARLTGIKGKITQLAKAGKPSEKEENSLRELEYKKPEPPKVPRLIYGDATPEALKWNLAKAWPSAGVISSEAGLVLGSHGMGKESVMRNLATLNQLWDGADIATERRTTESFTVRGARLTIALQVQEATLQSFFDQSGDLARGTGFLARFLVAWPDSTQGQRLFTDPPENWPALAEFNKSISLILNKSVRMEEDGSLCPTLLPLSKETKTAWVVFHDAIERELRFSGQLYDVRDVASKTADNAARIAALLQIFEDGSSTSIGLDAFEGAARIAAWHLHEARRFYGELSLPKEQMDVVRLDNWLLKFCKAEDTNIISRRDVQRNATPARLRKKATLDAAFDELLEAGRVREVMDGKSKTIHINPVLLEEDQQ
ncbi:MAG: DUF3987 domain-containing protein [Gammaproteobacteria bacterium]|nr:DUF3987 domain-containing protein [Gammaproteobacteria bacterium]